VDTVLVVDTVDRLARDMLITLSIRHEVERVGGRIEYANGTPPADTPEGELMCNILAAFAAYERTRISYATSRGIKRRQAEGEWFGQPPVGFQRDPSDSKKLIEHQQEQAAKDRAVQLGNMRNSPLPSLNRGPNSGEIAAILTKEFGCFRGKPWSARTVRKILAEARNTS
jgi:DNA invertase Pin-like site-specific DNA recombinase